MVENKQSETFVPPDILPIYQTLSSENGWQTTTEYNQWFYAHKPTIPKSSVKRWSRAFVTGKAHSVTPDWHIFYKENQSIVPDSFSALQDGQFSAAQEQLEKEGVIRYVNISDFHQPFGDGALLSLAGQIITDFKPNVFPFFSDWLDMSRFSLHAVKPSTVRNGNKPINKYDEFTNFSTVLINFISTCLPENCIRLNLWGNHENWILRYLLNISSGQDLDLVEWYITKYFELLKKHNILWVEADRNQFLPLTEHFWIGHGNKSRNGEGATARMYLNQMRGAVSIAAGHSHRQEVLWLKTPREEHFCAVAGTLGVLRPAYAHHSFMGHNWGFQVITHPTKGWKGAAVEDIRIYYEEGYYLAHWRGKEYSEKATVQYDIFQGIR